MTFEEFMVWYEIHDMPEMYEWQKDVIKSVIENEGAVVIQPGRKGGFVLVQKALRAYYEMEEEQNA